MRLSLVVTEVIQKLEMALDIRPGAIGHRADSNRRRKLGRQLLDAIIAIAAVETTLGSRARDAQTLAMARYQQHVGEEVRAYM